MRSATTPYASLSVVGVPELAGHSLVIRSDVWRFRRGITS